MKQKISNIMLFIGVLMLTGCSSKPPKQQLTKITEQEVQKYEIQYFSEYKEIKRNFQDTSKTKWIQASNKKEPCKLFVGVDKNDDRTLDQEYKIYWDGQCKNGYAYGLGREIEKGSMIDMEAIAIYKNAPTQEPEYFIQKYNLTNTIIEGNLNNNYTVITSINDDNMQINVDYKYGFFGSKDKPALLTSTSPFSDYTKYIKFYPNFMYEILDMTNNKFDTRNFIFSTRHKTLGYHGFNFAIQKQGNRFSSEHINNNFIRYVTLPPSFFNKANNIHNEIKKASQIALEAQKKALLVKKKYKRKICKKSVKVDFMDNSEYKEICREEEYNAKLKQKIDSKLATINQTKQQKLNQMNQQKLINAQNRQANAMQNQAYAASKSANAAQQSANAAKRANNLQLQQNTNNEIQTQKLNNAIMMKTWSKY